MMHGHLAAVMRHEAQLRLSVHIIQAAGAVVAARHKPLVSTAGQKLHRKNVGVMTAKHSNTLLMQ